MSLPIPVEDLRRTASELVALGGRTAARLIGKVSVDRKSDDSPVTQADHATQEAILRALADVHPSHAVLSEEVIAQPQRHAAVADSEYCWIIDPIDGTRNFARSVPLYASSVAVFFQGRPVAGAIFDASTQVVYSSSVDGGVFRDEVPMIRPDRQAQAETVIAVGSFRRKPPPAAVRSWLDTYAVRNHGSLCLHLAWLSAGLMDAVYSNECKLWDIAAGALIVAQAGCIVTDPEGHALWPVSLAAYHGEDVPILAGSKSVHDELRASLGGNC